jgi:hypothetical protein
MPALAIATTRTLEATASAFVAEDGVEHLGQAFIRIVLSLVRQ